MNDIAPAEGWMPIPGYADYEVSSFGRVRRVKPGRRNHACGVLKPWLNNKGYEMVGLTRDGRSISHLVSRLVCQAFKGDAPSQLHEVAHGDGNRRNNHATNLRWATRVENMADCVGHGTKATGPRHGRTTKPERTPRGERHGHSKLTEAMVSAIRSAPKSAGSGRALAKQHGISPATVCLIRSGKTWKHLTSQPEKQP